MHKRNETKCNTHEKRQNSLLEVYVMTFGAFSIPAKELQLKDDFRRRTFPELSLTGIWTNPN